MSEVFGSASDYSSSGIDSLAQAQDNYNTFGPNTDDSSAEQAIQNVLSNVGNRSNVRNSVNYDPLYAQAFNMSRGLQPGNRVEGVYPTSDNFYNPNYIDSANASNLQRPSYLQPQVTGQKGMYFSEGERFLQETLPPIIQGVRKLSPTGIIQTLIEQGQDAYNKGKGFLEETFTPEKKSEVGIMENMDRAEMTDVQRAIMAGFDNSRMNPIQIDPNTQTAMNLKDVQNFITRPDVVAKGLGYAQPYIQSLLPDGVNVDSGVIYDPEKPDDTYTGIKFTIPFSTG